MAIALPPIAEFVLTPQAPFVYAPTLVSVPRPAFRLTPQEPAVTGAAFGGGPRARYRLVPQVPVVGVQGRVNAPAPTFRLVPQVPVLSPGLPDADFANVSLLLPMDGSDGSTTFTDASSNGFTVTANGDAQIDTAQSKFDSASGLFDGSGDYLTIPHATELDLSSGDFTIEFWFRYVATGTDRTLLNKDGVFGASFPSYGVNLSTTAELITFLGNGNGLSPTVTSYTHGTPAAETWHFYTAVRTGTTIKTFLNGTQVTSATQGITMTDGGKSLYIASYSGASSAEAYSGHLSNLRITKGVARYTSSFTPPTAPFPTL